MNSRKVAFCTTPHLGGIYSVYLRMRNELAQYGWDVLCVDVGNNIQGLFKFEEELVDDGYNCLAKNANTMKEAAKVFADWVTDNDIAIVMPMSSMAAISAVPHLPSNVRVIGRAFEMTRYSYRISTANMKRLSRVVFSSPRQGNDLQRIFKVPINKLEHIPNGVDAERFNCTAPSKKSEFCVGYVGRIEIHNKNVMLLAEIAELLSRKGIAFRLLLVGEGAAKEELKSKLDALGSVNVKFVGGVASDKVKNYLCQMDALVLPSHREGFPSVLLEAMSCGVVPVCTQIKGVTDYIVTDGYDGFLCQVDSAVEFADCIAHLDSNLSVRNAMAIKGREKILNTFSYQIIGLKWNMMFSEVLNEHIEYREVSWGRYSNTGVFSPGILNKVIYKWIPINAKNYIKHLLRKVSLY